MTWTIVFHHGGRLRFAAKDKKGVITTCRLTHSQGPSLQSHSNERNVEHPTLQSHSGERASISCELHNYSEQYFQFVAQPWSYTDRQDQGGAAHRRTRT